MYVEKELLELKEKDNEVWIYFYLSNIGNKPTTIKKIRFYSTIKKDNSYYEPHLSILKVFEEQKLGIGRNLPTSDSLKRYESISFPYILNCNNTLRLLVKLDFSNKERFEKETNKDPLNFNVQISYSNKKYIDLL